jgi:hypothetical protein
MSNPCAGLVQGVVCAQHEATTTTTYLLVAQLVTALQVLVKQPLHTETQLAVLLSVLAPLQGPIANGSEVW